MVKHGRGFVTLVRRIKNARLLLNIKFSGVYTKNRAFRLLRSSKFDKSECFTVAAENQWKPKLKLSRPTCTPPSEAERQTFLASLVYFNQ